MSCLFKMIFAVHQRGFGIIFFEQFGKIGAIVKSAGKGDLRDLPVRCPQLDLGLLQADPVDIIGRGKSEVFSRVPKHLRHRTVQVFCDLRRAE